MLPQSDEVASWRDDVLSRAAFVYARAAARNEQALGVVARSLAALAAERGRKSLVFASGGLVQDPRLVDLPRGRQRGAARERGRVLPRRARARRPRTTGMSGRDRDADRVPRPGLVVHGGARARRGQRRRWPPTPAASACATRNDLAAGLARIGRESRSYYLLGYTPAEAQGRRALPQDRGQGGAGRASRCAPAAATTRPAGDGKREGGGRGARRRASSAPSTRRSTSPTCRCARSRTCWAVARAGQGLGAADRRGGRPRPRLRGEGRHVAKTRWSSCSSWRREDTGEFTRFDQQFEMSLRPETRARYEREGFPITRELALAPGRVPGARSWSRDRNGGRSRQPAPRVRGAGPRGPAGLERSR